MKFSQKIDKEKSKIKKMFNDIAENYDFLNHILSFNMDKLWRKKSIDILANSVKISKPEILDIATGTGDMAIAALFLNPNKIIGIDISDDMLKIARKKVIDNGIDKIEFFEGDCEKLNFDNNSFDIITIAFGIRNFEDINKSFSEIYRVLKPGGHLLILEFLRSDLYLLRLLNNIYLKLIIPLVGRIISKHKDAYSYLPKSMETFLLPNQLYNLLTENGFSVIKKRFFSIRIVCLYLAKKNNFK